MKKNIQEFGILAEQRVLLGEAFKHPLTKIQLSIAE